MEEQDYINKLFNEIKNDNIINNETIEIIHSRFPNSVIIQYYLGYYYEKRKDTIECIEKYKMCISLEPMFTPAYFGLYKFMKDPIKIYNHFNEIYFKKTYNNGENDKKTFNLKENILICKTLLPVLQNVYEYEKCIGMCNKIYEYIKNFPYNEIDYMCIETWKIINYQLGFMYFKLNSDKAFYYFYQGISKENYNVSILNFNFNKEQKILIHNLDKLLISSFLYSKCFIISETVPLLNLDKFYNIKNYKNTSKRNKKIHIGYITNNPDSPFLYNLLNNYDKNIFNIFIYNIDDINDKDLETYEKIKHKDGIDIMIDTVIHKNNKLLPVLSKSPCKIIINYLYPDSSRLSHNYYISNKNIKLDERLYTEKILNLDFLHFHWSSVNMYQVHKKAQSLDDKIRVAIFSDISKQNPTIRNIWYKVLEKDSRFELYILDNKLIKNLYRKFPSRNVYFLKQKNYNSIDLILDTYPHCDIQTVCEGLYNGIPCLTVANCNNLTESLLYHINEESFICENLNEYTQKILNFDKNSIDKQNLKNKFNNIMDNIDFLKKFENILISLYKVNDNNNNDVFDRHIQF